MTPPVSMVLGRTIEVAALVGCSTSTNVMYVALSGVIAPLGTSWTSEDAAAAQQSRVRQPPRGASSSIAGAGATRAGAAAEAHCGRHVEETTEKSGPPRAGDHGEPGEAATGDG